MEGAGSKECVKVVVRCRPPNKKEVSEGRSSIVQMNCSMGQCVIANPKEEGERALKRFTFDAVYDKDSTQRSVYDETAFPLVESVLEGFNGTIFAYGQTGAGKTWSMTGVYEDKDLRGIIPNSFDHIFETIKLTPDTEFLVRATYLEIYNEEIRDLLASDTSQQLQLKEDPDRGVFVKDLTFEVVEDKASIDVVLDRGSKNRTVGGTLMNAQSSRSHSIFTIVIEMNTKDEDDQNHFRAGKLNLVDLAGSERQSKTGATGSRLKEGIKINLSLSALGNVIKALVEGSGKHIPYRDSKLTRLLQDSLGGNTKTVMLSAISPADYNFEETLSTLRYADRAKKIKNKPKINEDPKDALLRTYKEEIENLKRMLMHNKDGTLEGAVALPGQQQLVYVESPAGEGGEGAGSASRTEYVDRVVERVVEGPVVEKVVEKEVVVTEVVEVVKEVQVISRQHEAEHTALLDYNDSVVQQRNRLGEELEAKDRLVEQERRERLALAQKLAKLQNMVLGTKNRRNSLNGSGELVEASNDPDIAKAEIALARKQREARRARLRLKEQKRKEAERAEQLRRANEAKASIEAEFENSKGEVEAKEQALKALKQAMIKKDDRFRQEIRDLEEEFQRERETLLNTIREQTKEMRLLEQVVELFLPARELSKVWELSSWDNDAQCWRVPRIKPRKGFVPISLPGLNNGGGGGSPENEGAVVDDAEYLERPASMGQRRCASGRSNGSSSRASNSRSGHDRWDEDPVSDGERVEYGGSNGGAGRSRKRPKDGKRSHRRQREEEQDERARSAEYDEFADDRERPPRHRSKGRRSRGSGDGRNDARRSRSRRRDGDYDEENDPVHSCGDVGGLGREVEDLAALRQRQHASGERGQSRRRHRRKEKGAADLAPLRAGSERPFSRETDMEGGGGRGRSSVPHPPLEPISPKR